MWSRRAWRVGISAILALVVFGVLGILLEYHDWPEFLAAIWCGICLLLMVVLTAALLIMRLELVTGAANKTLQATAAPPGS